MKKDRIIISYMKRIFLIAIMLFLVVLPANQAFASDKKHGDFTYRINNGKVTIMKYKGKDKEVIIPSKIKGIKVTGIGDNAFNENKTLTILKIPSGITKIGEFAFSYCIRLNTVELPKTLTSLGSHAFAGCVKLVDINAPKQLKSIGDSAFAGCGSLKSYSIPNRVMSIEGNTFQGCTGLTQIIIPDSVTKVGMRAFEKCSLLTEVKLPNSIKSIDSFAFNECTSLKKLNIPKDLTKIPYRCFYDCINLERLTLPNSITRIEDEAFYNCRKLVTNIPSQVQNIDNLAFYNCESLPDIILPEGIESVPNRAFYGCRAAKTLQIPDSVISLDKNAFDYCYSIKEVVIPDGVSTIPYFLSCNSLETIKISDNNKNYTIENGIIYNKDKSTLIRYTPANRLEGFKIPETVTTVADYAFSGLSTIKELTIPDTVKNIGIGLFYGSPSIENVKFPSSITELPKYTFYDTNLKAFIIPKNITKVGYQAFAYCRQLTSITIPASVTSIGDEGAGEATAAIPGCTNLKEFIVAADNIDYEAIDGVLYHKREDGKQSLICYPSQKADTSFKIPEGTTDMCISAFYQCDNLRKLYLPDSMTGIYNNFINCINLDIMVPKTVTRFMSDEHSTDWPIFTNCTNCYLYVKPDSEAYKYCLRNKEIPYKIWK